MKLNDLHRPAVSISAAEVARSIESGDSIAVIDARPLVEFDQRHAQPAIRLPLDLLEQGSRGVHRTIAALDAGLVVVIASSDREAARAATLLRDAGAERVMTLERGMEGWIQAGLPTVRRDRRSRDSMRLPVEVQVGAHSFVCF